MVLLHVKHGDENQFLYETDANIIIEELLKQLGLTDEQIVELKLDDEWGEKCIPSGGFNFVKDPYGKRNGKAPNEAMQKVINKSCQEVMAIISKKQVEEGKPITMKHIQNAFSILKGTVMIVYPMGLPPHDPIRMELENRECLEGTQDSKEVIEEHLAQLWFCGKEMILSKYLKDYVGKNEKTKVVIKLQKKGHGPPGREPLLNETEQKELMLHNYRRQEELKKLEECDDDYYLNSPWANPSSLKQSFHGLNKVTWKPH